MGTAYYDPRSVSLRLDKTICMYKGEPVFVEVDTPPERRQYDEDGRPLAPTPVEGDGFHILKMYKLDGRLGKPTKVDYREPEFDYRAFPLGYMNYMGYAYYLRRIPSRIQKQGLDRHYVAADPGTLQGSNWFFSKELKQAILGVYPSVKDTMLSIENATVQSQAIARNFAITFGSGGAHRLGYKGREVAYLDEGMEPTATGVKGPRWVLIHRKEREAMTRVIKAEFKESELCVA